MGFKSKKGEGKKKKGPKGKRARAKAKLERQWGETVDESQVTGLRRGKSRLLKHEPTKRTKPNKVDEESDVDIQVSSEESEVEEDAPALNLLLRSIKKESRNNRHRNEQSQGDSDHESSDEESESDTHVEDSRDMDYEVEESDEEAQVMSDGDSDEGGTSSDVDPFASHFNRGPYSDKELVQAVADSTKTFKASFPEVDSCLEFQLTDDNAEDASTLFRSNRQVLQRAWKRVNGPIVKSSTKEKKGLLSPFQSALYPSIATYKDAFLAAETRENRDELFNILSLHLLNHVLTSRGRIQRNNKKTKDNVDTAESLRDQGFTRPKVLILLPTRGTCYSFVKRIIELLGDPGRAENMDRFEEEYGPPQFDEDDDDEERAQRRRKVIQAKGTEWQELFGDNVNDDDDFKIGVSMTPKTVGDGGVSVKLYSDFYRSDFIIASPLGLKMALESEEDEESKDCDFLSSIEICLVAHSSVLLMQNWDHVNGVLECLNHQPKKNNDTDFGRVRNYLLSGQGQYWRQLIVTSSLSDPHIVSSFKRHAKSTAGRIKLRRRTPVEDASLCNVLVPLKQVFQRIHCNSFATQGKDRLKFFEERILPQIRKQKHTMIFIPSYFDFVSVRNVLLKTEVDFVSVTEYARSTEVNRGRARFLQGRKPLMLYTGRAHFFQRYQIKGVRHLIFYGIPEHSDFYAGLINNLNSGLKRESDDEEDMDMSARLSCLSVFTKYDALALERIVGTEHCNRMTKGDKSSYMFCS